MPNIIEHIDLLDGLNINPIPLEFTQEMTTTKWLCAIQAKVNKLIDLGNQWEIHANAYTDAQCAIIQKEYSDLMELISRGDIIQDNSIDLKKLKPTFINDLQELVIKYVHDTTKFVIFGLDKNGYFTADMPTSWNDLLFSTDIEGRLCLDTIS